MADQVIIEFVGDTSKLEEAYGKLNEQVTSSSSLNKESAAAFQKANADIASSFDNATDASKKFNEQLRNLGAVVAGGVLKDIISQLKAIDKAQGDVADSGKEIGRQITTLKTFAEVGRSISTGFGLASDALSLFGAKNEELEKVIAKVQAAMKVVNGLVEIQNRLNKESIVATEAQITKTAALTEAKLLEAEASEAESVASAGWIGAAVAGVTLLAVGIYKLLGNEREHAEQLRKIKDGIEDQNIELEYQKKLYEELGIQQTEIDRQLELNTGNKAELEHEEALRKRNNTLWMRFKQNVTEGNVDVRSDDQKAEDKKYEQEQDARQKRIKLIDTKADDEKAELAHEQAEREIRIKEDGFKQELDLYIFQREAEKVELGKRNASVAQLQAFQNETDKKVIQMQTSYRLSELKRRSEAELALIEFDGKAKLDLQKKIAKQQDDIVQADTSKSPEEKALSHNTYLGTIQKMDDDHAEKMEARREAWQKKQLDLDIQSDEVKKNYVQKYSDDDYKIFKDEQNKKFELAKLTDKAIGEDGSKAQKVFLAQQQLEEDK